MVAPGGPADAALDAPSAALAATPSAAALPADAADLPTIGASTARCTPFAAFARRAAARRPIALVPAAGASTAASATAAASATTTPDTSTIASSSPAAGTATHVSSRFPGLDCGLTAERRAICGRGRQPKVPAGSGAGGQQSPRQGPGELCL